MLFLIESTDNGKYRLLHSQTPHFKDTWLCDNSRNGINVAIPGSNGQTKKTLLKIFLDASFFYYKPHITRLFCSLNWYRQAFMALQTLCLFGFVVHPAPVFMHIAGAYHLAKRNSPGKNQWNYHEKMVKRNTTRLGPLWPEIFTRTEAFLLFLNRNFGIMESCHNFNHCLYSLYSRVVHLFMPPWGLPDPALGADVLKPASRSPIQRVNPFDSETVFAGVLARAISIIQSEQSYDHTSHAERRGKRAKKLASSFYLKAVAIAIAK